MRQSLDTPTARFAAVGLFLVAVLVGGGAAITAQSPEESSPPPPTFDVEIVGATLNFPQKAIRLPQVDRVDGATQVTLAFAFTGDDPIFEELALNDFRAYRETTGRGKGWQAVGVLDGEIRLKKKDMADLAEGMTVVKEVTLQVPPEGPLLVVPTAVLKVKHVGIAEILVIDPPPIWIYP